MTIEDKNWDTKDTNEYLFDNIQDGFLVENANDDNMHTFLDFKAIRMSYMNEDEHYYQLRNDFIEHLWTQNEDNKLTLTM